MKKKRFLLSKHNFGLLIILGLSLFLRCYQINKNPPSLNWDEVSHGYNAYSILKTSKDEWGKRFPLIFRAYGDYKLPLYIYLTVIPVKIFGLSPLGVRLISILAGVGLTWVSYFLAKKLSGQKIIGITAALLTAIMPWSLFLSRVAVEANLGAFLFALGCLFLIKQQPVLTAINWGLSLYAYNSARILVPLFSIILLAKLLVEKNYRRLVISALILALSIAPVIYQFTTDSGKARFYWVNIIDQGVVNQINQKRGNSQLPHIGKKLLYNRPTYFISTAFKNYFNHFSPKWLFLRGGEHYQFSFPGHGLIYLVSAPFFILGVVFLIKEKKWFWLSWLFASFLPSAITKDSPHVLRSIFILPLPMVLSAFGIGKIINWLKDKSCFKGWGLVVVFCAVNLVSFGLWWRQYWNIYRQNYSWSWQYGYKQAVQYVKQNYGKYDEIIFTKRYGEPHEFILFYWPWEPSYYQNDSKKVWDYHTHWYWIDAFDKFEFWNDWEVVEKLKIKSEKFKKSNNETRILLITSPGNYIEGGEIVKTIDFLHQQPAFEIVNYQWED
jgi:4-amino-4-deoxy-L-arabinose transferase-like glycosyltransferase